MVIHDKGAFLYASRHSLPFLVNGAARTDPGADAETVVDLAVGFFSDLGRGFEILCLEGRDEDLAEAAEAAGLTIGSPDPMQALGGRQTRQPSTSPESRFESSPMRQKSALLPR